MGLFSKPKIDYSYQEFQKQEAIRQRQEEEARQKRIQSGINRVAAIFDGGTWAENGTRKKVGTRKIQNEGWDPSAAQYIQKEAGNAAANPYYLAKNHDYVPQYRTEDVFETTPGKEYSYEGFKPILDQRRSAMEGFYFPQLDDQYSDAQDQMLFALSRAGIGKSTMAADKYSDLTDRFGLEKANIYSQIDTDLSRTRSDINQKRNAIEAGLRASGDATAASNQALAAMSTFADDQPRLSPLVDLFGGLAATIGAAKKGADVGAITGKKAGILDIFNGGSGRNVR